MIRTVIFDMDGTLVKTERLKALSYAAAADELVPGVEHEQAALDAWADVVGMPRMDAATHLLKALDVEEAAAARVDEFEVSDPWQVLVQIRLVAFEKEMADADMIRANQWEHNVQLLHKVRELGYPLALATASTRKTTRYVLETIGLWGVFDFVATCDDVERGKPDPEIYLLVARELETDPRDCLVIEDTPTGVRAALAAGMSCIAVSTQFTRKRLHSEGLLDKRWIVDDPDTLPATFEALLEEQCAAS